MKNMNKKRIFPVLLSMILSISFLTYTNQQNDTDTVQIGAACTYKAFTSEGGDAGAYTAGAGIAFGVGYGMIQVGVPNGWNPVGWGCLIAGSVL